MQISNIKNKYLHKGSNNVLRLFVLTAYVSYVESFLFSPHFLDCFSCRYIQLREYIRLLAFGRKKKFQNQRWPASQDFLDEYAPSQLSKTILHAWKINHYFIAYNVIFFYLIYQMLYDSILNLIRDLILNVIWEKCCIITLSQDIDIYLIYKKNYD